MRWFLRFLLFRWLGLPAAEDELRMELLAARQQLAVMMQGNPRPRLNRWHRILWAWLSQVWPRWKEACVLVKPATVISWHRAGFRLFWRWKWMIAHVNVTTNPTAEWVTQQFREAFPFDEIPKYLIFDNDTTFSAVKSFVESMGITPKRTAFHCPWQNGAVERFNGTLRRELLDHVVVLNEAHLRRLLKEFLAYYHEDRTHLALGKDAPKGRHEEIPPNSTARVEALPRVGGLHHRYVWRDAA